jgi:Flp pilus assembly protein TadG
MRPVTSARWNRQSGQSIVLIAMVLTVLFGFVGLAIDSGRGYLDRRHVQGSVDAAALAAAFDYMNNHDYGQAETAAVNQFANNERLYGTPTCAGLGSVTVSCTFGDPGNTALTLNVADHSIAGVSFKATATHRVGIAMMQVLGFGSTMGVGATATAVARPPGQNGAALQTLSPGSCASGSPSLVFTGTSTTSIVGDIWSNGSINDNGSAGGTVNGNVINICPAYPPTAVPNFTVTGSQATGFNIPDPGYPQQALDPTARSWNSTNGSTELPGSYPADPRLTGSAGCYFLSGGIYNLTGGFTQNGGFLSNVLRPPDEPNMASAGNPNITTLNGDLTGTGRTSIPVAAIPGSIPSGSILYVSNQAFTTSGNTAAGATSIGISRQDVTGTIPDGTSVAVRTKVQFWDSNAANCDGSFSLTSKVSDLSNPPVNAQTYAVELTSVRWQPNGVSNCSGPSGPTCYLRESAPSACKTVVVKNNQHFSVDISPAQPGAQSFNVYISPSGSCGGPFGYLTNINAGGGNINGGMFTGWRIDPSAQLDTDGAPPPDGEGMPMGAGLPNADPPPAAPPSGDLANSGHCVDPATGANVSCPSGWTVGAVQFFIPGGGSNSVCLNLQGGGDIWVYSGYQYQRILLFEPGPAQPPPYNTCLNNVAGHGITNLMGIFYTPAASITIVGSSSYLATIAGGVIAWTATVKGNGGVSIMADPTLRTWPSAVRLTN